MKTNGEILRAALDRLVRNGEIPYQANRRAVRVLDIYNDAEEGRQELIVMLEGLDIFIADMEAFENVAGLVARQTSAALR